MSGDAPAPVDILRVRFPRMTQEQALRLLLLRLEQGRTTGVCFPDMSTLNLAAERPGFRRLLQGRLLTFNDGAGLAWAARLLKRPFPANLNGTDLCPRLLQGAPAGTSVYVLGARQEVVTRARDVLAQRHPHLRFVGCHHGYLDRALEEQVVQELRSLRPRIVLVAMGNPLQVEFIDRHLDDPQLGGTMWLAIGGQLDYYGGTLVRAPAWVRKVRLEWLHIVLRQPYKARRYFVGIPQFLLRCAWAQLTGGHAMPEEDGKAS